MKPTLKLNLAATYTSDMELTFPKYASPKYDGIRMTVIDGKAYSRNMILIPNLKIQAYFADGVCNGLDGELFSGKHDADVFKRTSSVVRSIDGSNDWHFKVFDIVAPDMTFTARLDWLRCQMKFLQEQQYNKVSIVPQTIVFGLEELQAYEEQCLADGYEGVMLRNPTAPYKHGRATPNSQDLLKVKRFEDSEAKVLGWSPLVDAKTGQVKAGLMGALQVRDIHTGVEFSVGSGFDMSDRELLHNVPPLGEFMTYQHFPQGAYEKPRFPTFKGFRTDIDLTTAKYA